MNPVFSECLKLAKTSWVRGQRDGKPKVPEGCTCPGPTGLAGIHFPVFPLLVLWTPLRRARDEVQASSRSRPWSEGRGHVVYPRGSGYPGEECCKKGKPSDSRCHIRLATEVGKYGLDSLM